MEFRSHHRTALRAAGAAALVLALAAAGTTIGWSAAGVASAARSVAAAPAEARAPLVERTRAKIRVWPTSVRSGGRVKVSGRVPHGPRKVRIQVRQGGGGWRTARSVRSKRSGSWRTSIVVPVRPGAYRVRAVAPRAKVRGERRAKARSRAVPLTVRSTGGPTPSAAEAQVLNLVNSRRAAAGCGPLAWDSRLAAAARGHSADMAKNKFLSHTGSNGSTTASRISKAKYPWTKIGENVAWNQDTAAEVMAGWMASQTHRDNILNCGFIDLGVSMVRSSGGEEYWTQDFGRR